MLGGGPGSLIGPVHRMAAQLDDRFALVAGVFSRDREASLARAREWGIDPTRVYADIDELLAQEAAREDGIVALAITTPNHTHAEIACKALAAGVHVICDKPMTATLAEAEELAAAAAQSGALFALTHTYTGYPMVREARERVLGGAIGAVRKILVDYSQGWLSEEPGEDNRQAAWRTDPALAGAGGCIGDIGVHAFQIAEWISGLRAERLTACLSRIVPGRTLDDDANVMLRMEGNVPAIVSSTQIAAGERNNLRLRIFGETGSIEWSHEAPDTLRILRDEGDTLLYAGGATTSERALASTRIPGGHPEGFIEAFANLYADVADAIGGGDDAARTRLIGAEEGLRSLQFISAAVASSDNGRWIEFGEKQ